MRLLTYNSDDELCLTRDFAKKDIPPYAILSHTWGQDEEEISFQDLALETSKRKAGYAKIEFCGRQARRDGWRYCWVDTCCIDKTNSTELSKAITSMYHWYQNAQVCYVYLADVSFAREDIEAMADSQLTGRPWESSFRTSRWFKRGWTLQELLAPRELVFYSREGEILGSRNRLKDLISEITNIPTLALDGQSLSEFPVDERMRWTEGRVTKEEEDRAYCLLGIFNVFMPLIYGEGENAFRRLWKEINDRRNGNSPAYSNCESPRRLADIRSHGLESDQISARDFGVKPYLGTGEATKSSRLAKKCQCSRNKLTTPVTFRKLLGQLSVRLFCKKCSRFSTDIVIWLPGWLAERNLYFVGQQLASGSPSVGLTFQRRIPWGRDDSILRFCLSRNLTGARQILLSGKASLYDIDPNHGMTALHYAVQQSAVEICRFLLHEGADANFEDGHQKTASQKAWEQILANRGSPYVLNQLRELFSGHDLEDWSFSHLHMVVLKLRPVALNNQLRLLDCKEQLDSVDAMRRTPLHWAACRGDATAVAELLEAGASSDPVDDCGATPLILGASTGNIAVIELLISYGADVNQTSFRGDTPLHYASRHQQCVAPVKQLIHFGASIDSKNKVGNTPLTGAAITNKWEICDYLIEREADIHNRGMYGDTPLFESIYHNSHECMSVLLKHGARTTDVNFDGRSILHAVALEGNLETVKLLMDTDIVMPGPQIENAQHETAWQVYQKRLHSPEGFGHLFRQLLDRSSNNEWAEAEHTLQHRVLQDES